MRELPVVIGDRDRIRQAIVPRRATHYDTDRRERNNWMDRTKCRLVTKPVASTFRYAP